MALLEAIVAFSLAMLVFSSLVTAIAEVAVNRIFKLRQQGFQQLLENIYDQVIVPRLGHYLAAAQADATLGREAFVKALMRNPARDQTDNRKLTDLVSSRKVSTLTAFEFIEKLAETDVGKALARQTKGRKDALVDDLALKFERYANGAQEYFRQRAQSFSIFIAIFLALSFNIEVARLFQGFLENPAARERLLAQADQIAATFKGASQTEPRKPGATVQGEEAEVMLEQVSEDVRKTLAKVGTEIDDLSAMGLAVGHGYFPMCSVSLSARPADEKLATIEGRWTGTVKVTNNGGAEKRTLIADARDPHCRGIREAVLTKVQNCVDGKNGDGGNDGRNANQSSSPGLPACFDEATGFLASLSAMPFASGIFWQWAVLCILAGVLIGLGGPFWFNLYSNLSRVLQVARTVRGMFGKQQKQQAEGQAASGGEGARQPKTPVETFDRVMAAAGVTSSGPDVTWEEFRERHRRGRKR